MRRQIQPGNDCLRVDKNGYIIIDAVGPERVIDTTRRWKWFIQGIESIAQASKRSKHFGQLIVTASGTHGWMGKVLQPLGEPAFIPSSPKKPTSGSAQWSRLSIIMAFAGLFTLGMAVEHRAEIVDWSVLRLALDGRMPTRLIDMVGPAARDKTMTPTHFREARAAASAPMPAASAQNVPVPARARAAAAVKFTTPAIQVRPVVAATVINSGAHLAEIPNQLPPPLPEAVHTLLDRSPRRERRIITKRPSERDDMDGRTQEQAVTVVLRNARRAATPRQPETAGQNSSGVDVDLSIPPSSQTSSTKEHAATLNFPAPAAPAQSNSFVAVTTNGGDLVVRNSSTNKFHQVAPGDRLPNGQTLTRINEANGTFTTNAGTFNYGE